MGTSAIDILGLRPAQPDDPKNHTPTLPAPVPTSVESVQDAASVLRLQRLTGLPGAVVQRDQTAVRDGFTAEQLRQIDPAIAPATVDWMRTDPRRTSLIQNDFERASWFERQWAAIRTEKKRGDLLELQVPLLERAMFQPGDFTPNDDQRVRALGAMAQALPDVAGGMNVAGRILPAMAGQLTQMTESYIESLPKAGAAAAIAAGVTGAVTANPATAARVGRIVGGSAFTMSMAWSAGRREMVHAFAELRDITDETTGLQMPHESAVGAAMLVGVVAGALEVLPAEMLKRMTPGLRGLGVSGIRQLLQAQTTRNAISGYVSGLGKAAISEGGTEFAQSLVSSTARVISEMALDGSLESAGPAEVMQRLFALEGIEEGGVADLVGRVWDSPVVRQAREEAELGMLAGGGFAGSFGAVSLASDIARARRVEAFSTAVGELLENAGQMEATQAAPQEMESLFADITQQEQWYYDPNEFTAYWQSITDPVTNKPVDPAMVAAELLGDRAAFDQAVELQQPFAIPASAIIAKLGRHEAHRQFAIDAAMESPQTMSRQAARGRAAQVRTLLDEIAKAGAVASEDAALEAELAETAAEIEAGFRSQLETLGYKPDELEANTKLAGDVFRGLMREYGMSAEEARGIAEATIVTDGDGVGALLPVLAKAMSRPAPWQGPAQATTKPPAFTEPAPGPEASPEEVQAYTDRRDAAERARATESQLMVDAQGPQGPVRDRRGRMVPNLKGAATRALAEEYVALRETVSELSGQWEGVAQTPDAFAALTMIDNTRMARNNRDVYGLEDAIALLDTEGVWGEDRIEAIKDIGRRYARAMTEQARVDAEIRRRNLDPDALLAERERMEGAYNPDETRGDASFEFEMDDGPAFYQAIRMIRRDPTKPAFPGDNPTWPTERRLAAWQQNVRAGGRRAVDKLDKPRQARLAEELVAWQMMMDAGLKPYPYPIEAADAKDLAYQRALNEEMEIRRQVDILRAEIEGTALEQAAFHGSPTSGITQFDRLAPRELGGKQNRMDSVGSWFSLNADETKPFLAGWDWTRNEMVEAEGGTLYEVDLDYSNPKKYASWQALLDDFNVAVGRDFKNLPADTRGPEGVFPDGGNIFNEYLKNQGYDAIEVEQIGGIDVAAPSQSYVAVLSPETQVTITHRNGEAVTATDRADFLAQEQTLPETLDVGGVTRPTRNSTGQLIHPNPAGVEAFWRWATADGRQPIADDQGRPIRLFHGTAAGTIDQFDIDAGLFDRDGTGTFLTTDPGTAETYGGDQGSVYPVYVRSAPPVEVDAAGAVWNELSPDARVINADGTLTTAKRAAATLGGDVTTNTLARYARAAGAEALVIANVVDVGSPTALRSATPATLVVVFDEKNIKSAIANAGTFDPTGNILYQDAAQSPRLTVQHRLSPDSLLFADQLGGLAVPSLGVTREGLNYTGMGSVTLIGRAHLGDPTQVPIHDADVYSRTFPTPNYKKPKAKDVKALADFFLPWEAKFEERVLTYQIYEYAQKGLVRELTQLLRRSEAVQAAYLAEQGVPIEPKMKPAHLRMPWVDTPSWRAFLAGEGWNYNKAHDDEGYRARLTAAIGEAVEEYVRTIRNARWRKEERQAYREQMLNADGLVNLGVLYAIQTSNENLDRMRVDSEALRTDLEAAFAEPFVTERFERWITEKAMPMFGAPRIKVDGRLQPYTLENISAYMAGEVVNQEQTMTFGAGKARAAAAIRFRTMDWMRNASDRIGSPEEVKAARVQAEELLSRYRSAAAPFYEYSDTWAAMDGSMRALARWAKGTDIKEALRREGFKKVPQEVLAQALEAGRAMMDAPVPYFEAKPQRAVLLSEFAGAVVPQTVAPEVLDVLSRNGLAVQMYDADVGDTAEAAAVQQLSAALDASGEPVFFQEPTFYSPLERAVRSAKAEVQPASQWLAWLKANGGKLGVKAMEMEWSGVEDFLTMEGNNRITRAELEEFLADNGVAVKETVLEDVETLMEKMERDPGFVAEVAEMEDRVRAERWDDFWDSYVNNSDDMPYVEMDDEVEDGPRFKVSSRYGNLGGDTMYETEGEAQEEVYRMQDDLEKEVYRDWLRENGDEIHREARDAVMETRDTGLGATEYGNWQLPGGVDYREVLLNLPDDDRIKETHTSQHYHENPGTDENLLGWARVTTRRLPTGESVLFVEEVQSDWAQEGRERGFGDSARAQAARAEVEAAREVMENTYNVMRGAEQSMKRTVNNLLNRHPTLDGWGVWVDSVLLAKLEAAGLDFAFPDDTDIRFRTHDYPVSGPDSLEVARQWLGFAKKENLYAQQRGNEVQAKLGPAAFAELLAFDPTESFRKSAESWLEARARRIEALGRYTEAQSQVETGPTRGPFVTETEAWVSLVVKKIISMAAREGHAAVAWTTGEQQAQRWSKALQESVSKIDWEKVSDKRVKITAVPRNGGDNIVQELDHRNLRKNVGADVADQILTSSEASGSVSGDNLTVGGLGFAAFYDGILPQAVEKVLKKLGGGKVETLDIAPVRRTMFEPGKMSQPGFRISPQLKALASQPLPLFKRMPPESGPRGRFFRTKDGKRVIELAGKRDRTTFAHELSHYYFDILEELVARPDANARAVADYTAVRDWQAKAWEEIQRQAARHFRNVPPAAMDEMKERLALLGEQQVVAAIRMRTRDASDPVDLAIRIAAEEYWARGWESWLMEGTAPSRRLRTAFAAYARWMKAAYGDADALEVNVSDDVREMMRRLLASEDAIAQANADMARAPLPMDGMTEGARTRYITLQLEARDYAEDRLRAEIMEDLERIRSQEYQARWEETLERVTAEVHADPAYRAREALTNGRLPDGTALPPQSMAHQGINRAMAIALIGAEDVQRVPTRALRKDGANPQLLADAFGFDTGTQLLEALAGTERMSDHITKLTERRMQELYPQLLGSPQLSEEALSAIHNERQDAVLKWEAEWLMENAPQMVATVASAAGRARLLPRAEVTEQARAFLRTRPVNSLRPDEYRRGEVTAHNESIRLARTGDFVGAVAAKERERLAHALYREARDLKTAIPKMRREMAQAWKSDKKIAETRHLPFVLGMRAVLASVGIGRSQQPAQYYLDKISAYAPEDAEDVRALVNSLTVAPGTDAEALSVADFFEVHRVAMALWRKALQVEQFTTAEGKVALETVLRPAILELNALSPMMGDAGRLTSFSATDQMKSVLLGAGALGRRVLPWINAMDKNEFGGAFHVLFRDPIYAATPKLNAALEVSRAELKRLADEMGPLPDVAIPAPELSVVKADGKLGTFTWRNHAHLIGGLLHAGNEGNLRKNLEGRGWSASGWSAMLERMYAEGHLEERHLRFVQGVWDLFESLKTPLWAAHYELRGYWPAEVVAAPLVTPWGVFRGGYAPAVRDPDLDTSEDQRMAERAFEDQHGFSFPAQVASGMTKERTDAVGPLWMDYRLIEKHIADVQKFIHLANPVREISRVLTNREFAAAMNRVNPKWIPGLLLPWLQRTGAQLVELPVSKHLRPLANLARTVRSRAALSLMVANVPNTLEQITGIAIAKTRIPAGFLRRANMRFLQQPQAMITASFELSDFLRGNTSTRMADLQREFRNVLLSPTILERTDQFFQTHGYILQQMTQGYVNQVVWAAAFDYASSEGRTEAQSVQFADDQIRLTQGSFNPEDASALETGTAFAKLFTTFIGYFNMLANLNATEFQVTVKEMGLRKGAGRLFYVYLYGFLIPMVTSRMIRNAFNTAGTQAGLSLVGADEDEDGWVDEFLATLFGAQFQGATAMVPFAGAVVQTAVNRLDNQRWNDQLRISPALSLIDEATAGGPAAVAALAALLTDAELSKRQVRDMWALLTLLGVPTAALRRATGYLQDVQSGTIEPSGPIDFTRGVLSGR